MMLSTGTLLLMALAAVGAGAYLIWFCHRPPSTLKTLVKTVSVLSLAGAAWWAEGPALLVLALMLCALGDFCLSLKGESAFLVGVGAFAAGHIGYIVLFLSMPSSDMAIVPIAAMIGLIGFAVVMMTLLYRNAGALRFAVLGYVPVIVGMALAAMTVPPLGALALVVPAAVLFMVSDTVLASEMFLLRPDQPLRRVTPFVIWALYWLAQLGFVISFVAA